MLATVLATQIAIVIGTMGYISFRQGRHAVNDLANQLMIETGSRIDNNLSDYMRNIENITKANAALVKTGILDSGNTSALRQHFWEQLHNFEFASTVALGTEKRDFMALERDSISFILREYDRKTRTYTSYRLSEKGEKTVKTGIIENFDPLNDPPHDPWYVRAKTQGSSCWLLVVTMAKGPDDPELMMVNFLPIYNKQKQMLGVAASSIYLSRFGQFLSALKIGKNGQAFLIDQKGILITTSTGEMPFYKKGRGTYEETMKSEKGRVAAIESKNPITSAAAKNIMREYGNLSSITQPRLITFQEKGVPYLLKIIPINKNELNWFTVIIVPEKDFMEDINRNTQYTLLLFVLGLTAAVFTAVITARWVTSPILHLNTVAKKIAGGNGTSRYRSSVPTKSAS